MEKEKVPAVEAKKEDMKKEKASTAFDNMITELFNNSKEKGHTRGLITEHGYIKFHLFGWGVLGCRGFHPSFRTT